MIAISIVAVWLVVGLGIGALFGTAIRKASGDQDADTVPDRPAAQVRYLRKSQAEPDTLNAKHVAKHHAAA